MQRFQYRHQSTLYFPVALCVVTTGSGVLCACGDENSSEQLGQKLGSSIGVDNVRCATGEPYCVEEGGNEGGRGVVLEGEDKYGFREAVHDSQSFGLASDGLTLALEVHGVAGAGLWVVGRRRVRGRDVAYLSRFRIQRNPRAGDECRRAWTAKSSAERERYAPWRGRGGVGRRDVGE